MRYALLVFAIVLVLPWSRAAPQSVTWPMGEFAPGGTLLSSKLNSYAVLNSQDMQAAKLNSYAVLNSAVLSASKLVSYLVMTQVAERVLKMNTYIVLNFGQQRIIKTNTYVILEPTAPSGVHPWSPLTHW